MQSLQSWCRAGAIQQRALLVLEPARWDWMLASPRNGRWIWFSVLVLLCLPNLLGIFISIVGLMLSWVPPFPFSSTISILCQVQVRRAYCNSLDNSLTFWILNCTVSSIICLDYYSSIHVCATISTGPHSRKRSCRLIQIENTALLVHVSIPIFCHHVACIVSRINKSHTATLRQPDGLTAHGSIFRYLLTCVVE